MNDYCRDVAKLLIPKCSKFYKQKKSRYVVVLWWYYTVLSHMPCHETTENNNIARAEKKKNYENKCRELETTVNRAKMNSICHLVPRVL